MIFFGSRGKVVAGEPVQGIQCQSCEKSQHASFGILNYFHVYWIPTFLTSRKVGIECQHCKKTLVGNEVPSHVADQIKPDIFTLGRTLPMFSGLILIAILVVVINYNGQRNDAREAAYIEQPAVNDYYVVDLTEIFVDVDAEFPYGVMRVTDVSSEGIEMQVANVVYNMASGVKKDIRAGEAAKDSYYDSEPVVFDFSELHELNNSGAINSIER